MTELLPSGQRVLPADGLAREEALNRFLDSENSGTAYLLETIKVFKEKNKQTMKDKYLSGMVEGLLPRAEAWNRPLLVL